MIRAHQALGRLPGPVSNNLSYLSGVIASHPSAQAREAAFERLCVAAHHMREALASQGPGDGLCEICDAEAEAEA